MRTTIFLLVGLMLILLGNIIAYSMSEDYRFFVKKIKYSDEVVYKNSEKIDDSQRIILVEDASTDRTSKDDIIVEGEQGVTFLDVLGRQDTSPEDKQLPEMTFREKEILEMFKNSYVLDENISPTSLFDITTEYPDDYREYENKHISLYMFSTKTYQQVYDIFDVLAYELPYSLNETNNFGENSFYVNLQGVYADDIVRIVFEYENKAFGLKIRKDNYNTVKQILEQLDVQ